MHIHVICGGHEAKYWLEPRVELAKNSNYSVIITASVVSCWNESNYSVMYP